VAIIPIVQMISILPWTLMSRFIGKRWAWIVGLAIAAAALLLLFAMAHPNMTALYALLSLYAVGSASIAVNFWSIVPDTVEFGEWRSGVRAEGFIFGFVTLIQKIAFGLSTAFVGAYLVWVGYVANKAQTPEALAGLSFLITVIAVIGLAASCIVIYFYRLSTESHAQLVREIAARPQVSAT
jgi:GPH family glycoside/pentoside/hexuronide:cation symporter